MNYYQCPCCLFSSLEYEDSFDICPICDWEDDPIQSRYPYSDIGANQKSLFSSQKQILQKLPIEVKFFKANGMIYTRNEKMKYTIIKSLDTIENINSETKYIEELQNLN